MEVTETFEASVQLRRNDAALGARLRLVVLWMADELGRVGEVALAPDVRPGATHVRELESPLWQAMSASTGDTLAGGAGPPSHVPKDRLHDTGPPSRPAPGIHVPENMLSEPGPMGQADSTRAEHAPLTIAPDVLPASLDRHEGRQEPAGRELGLSSRHVRTRLVRRYDLHLRGRGGA